jgi:hypothetical protein
MREWTRDCLHPAKNVRTETPHPQRHTSWRVIHPCTAMGTHRLQPTAGKHHCARITVYAKRDACSTAPPNHEALLNRPNSNSWRTHSRPTLHANDPANMAIDGDGRQTTCLQPRKGLSKQSLPLPPSNPDTRFFAFCFASQRHQTATTRRGTWPQPPLNIAAASVLHLAKGRGSIPTNPAGCCATSRPHAVLGTPTQSHAMRRHPHPQPHIIRRAPIPAMNQATKAHENTRVVESCCRPTEAGMLDGATKATPTRTCSHAQSPLHMCTQGWKLAGDGKLALRCKGHKSLGNKPQTHSQGELHAGRQAWGQHEA